MYLLFSSIFKCIFFTYDGFYITIKICLTIYIITVGFLFLVHALTNVANTEYLINVENIQLNS